MNNFTNTRHFVLIFTVALITILLNFVNISAQEKVMDKMEFEAIILNADKVMLTKTIRTTRTVERFSDKTKIADSRIESVSERIPPDRSRFYQKEVNGKITATMERITIGDKSFFRVNEKAWTTEVPSAFMASAGSAPVPSESYKFVEKAKLNGKPVTIYESVFKTTNYNTVEIQTIRYWIGADGSIVQETETVETVGTNKLVKTHKSFDTNAKVKIEAPVK